MADDPGIYDLLATLLGATGQGQGQQPPAQPAQVPRPQSAPQPTPYYASGQGAGAYQQPPMSPAAQAEIGQATGQPNQGGDSAMFGNALGSTIGAGASAPPPQQPGGPPWQTLGPPPAQGGPQQGGPPMPPQPGQIPPNAMAQAQNPQLMGPGQPAPMPPPRPQMPPPGPSPMPQQQQPQAPPPMPGPAPGMPPPQAQGGPQPGYQTAYQPRTGFMGMTPEQASRLGAGLSAVGQNWNKPGLAALAGTAGASIQAGEKTGEAQKAEDLKANAQHFNQMSTSFRDMMTAQQQQNMQGYRAAQAKYLSARADAIASGQGTGSNAVANTPQGRVLAIEKQSEVQFKNRALILQQQWKQNGTPEAQQNQQLEVLRQQTDQQKTAMYQKMGMTPQQAEQIKNQGTSQANPIDTKGMTQQQFHSQVPLGGWFRNPDGRVMQRTKPPPGVEQQPQSSNAPNMDDMQAMSPAQEQPIPTSPMN